LTAFKPLNRMDFPLDPAIPWIVCPSKHRFMNQKLTSATLLASSCRLASAPAPGAVPWDSRSAGQRIRPGADDASSVYWNRPEWRGAYISFVVILAGDAILAVRCHGSSSNNAQLLASPLPPWPGLYRKERGSQDRMSWQGMAGQAEKKTAKRAGLTPRTRVTLASP